MKPITRVIITVSEEHIRLGKRGSILWCPIALALKEAGFLMVVVGSDFLTWDSDHIENYATPKEVKTFLAAFDDYQPVSPFSFTIDIPSEAA